MQKEHFYNALDDVKSKLPPLRDDLINLTQAYPWFSAAHLLLAKTDHLTGHVAFDANLKRAAVYAGQREALFDLIHKEAFTDKVRAFEAEVERFSEDGVFSEESEEGGVKSDEVVAQSEEVAEPLAEVETSQDAETLEPAELAETEPTLEKELLGTEEGPEVPDMPTEVEETIGDTEEQTTSEQNDEEPEIKHLDDFDGLQREILLEAISSSIEKEVQEEKVIESEPAIDQPAVPEVEESNADLSETTIAQSSSFTAFLKKRSAEIQWEGGAEEAPEIPVVKGEERSELLSPDQLIDKFIAADPKITPRKSAEFSNENLAKKSLVEDEQFVTETIARIYAKQGATRKAIKAYKLLSLKYPEKSIYFAHQIKKLQDRRKSTK